MFELTMVNESSVFELLRFDCMFHGQKRSIHCTASMTRSPMARLTWLIRTLVWVPKHSSDSSRKQMFRDVLGKISSYIMNVYVMCTHKNHLI